MTFILFFIALALIDISHTLKRQEKNTIEEMRMKDLRIKTLTDSINKINK